MAESYRAEGIPVDNDGRIDMTAYTGIYSDVQKDLDRNREWEEKYYNGATPDEAREQRLRADGERLEMLAQAIFAKNFGADFVVTRSSPHDDRVNKTDTVLLERKTGNVVCAFDEVGHMNGARYDEKLRIIQEHNLKGGTSLKYGLGIERDGEEARIIGTEVHNIPLFYLALPKDRVEKGLQEFDPSPTEQSDFEKKLFDYFIATLGAQIQGLELYSGRLNPQLKERLSAFKKAASEIKSKREIKK